MQRKHRERILRRAMQDQADVRTEPEKEPDEEEEDLGPGPLRADVAVRSVRRPSP